MKNFLLSIVFLATITGSCVDALAQGEAAVPILLIASSPASNGWGGISTAVVSDNAFAPIANPGQIGLFSLTNLFSAATYAPKTQWLPTFQQSDLTYTASAVSAGVTLNRFWDVPVPVSIGFGYARIYFDLGQFVVTGSGGPNPIAVINPFEKVESFSVGVGVDYFVRLGIGMNFKSITSSSPPYLAKPSATDFGVLVQIPVIRILSQATGNEYAVLPNVEPVFDINFGYSRNNSGNDVFYYNSTSLPDPLPRNATIGFSTELGLETKVRERSLKIIAFTLAREAEDLLVTRKPDGTFGYQSGLGDISFFRHVIQGQLRSDDRANLHKGWQINLADLICVRGGSFSESPRFGNRNYTTSGFGIRLRGLLALIQSLNPTTEENVLSFLADHVDLTYDRAEYTTPGNPLDGTTFAALNLIIR